MADAHINDEEIDEAEEEELLKSDEDTSNAASLKANATIATEEDSLMNEASNSADLATQKGNRDAGDTDSHTDDDSDDDDSDGDEALLSFKKLLKELQQNQYAYDKYLQLCELSHSTDDLENIRTAYHLFAKAYPLAPELWLKYLSSEGSVAHSDKEVAKLVQLYRRALNDYYSADIALEFAALAPRTAEPQLIWEELLSTYGWHWAQGRELFKRYRQYIADNDTLSDVAKQAAFTQSYQQELQYPLTDMEESYIEFKVQHEKRKATSPPIDWHRLDKLYYHAKEQLRCIVVPHEQKLQQLKSHCYRERAEVYVAYIEAASAGRMAAPQLQTLYERMVTACCLNADCWLRYIDYIDRRDEAEERRPPLPAYALYQQDAVALSARALRNCSWAEALYIQRMQLLEQRESSRYDVQEVLESSVTAGFQSAEPAVAIWLAYLTYLRRHTDWSDEDQCELLRKNFDLAWTILGQQWGVLADCNCEILQFRGRLEYGPLQDGKRGKELWSTVMESADNASKSALWVEFAQLELRRDLEGTRRLYRKALHVPALDNPLALAAAWERFERCNGSAKSLAACLKECGEFRTASQVASHLKAPNSQSSGKATAAKGVKRKGPAPTDADAPLVKNAKAISTATTDSVKGGSSGGGSGGGFKQHESEAIDLSKDHLRIFLSNLDYELSEADVLASLPELEVERVDLVRAANGRSRGFGYLELTSAAEVAKALAMDRRTLRGRPLFVSSVLRDKEQRQKFKYAATLEPQKLFVKGLPPDTTKEELQTLFGVHGLLRDVRLVQHKSGKFKQIAYVEYESEGAARKALQLLDQSDLRGHQMSVAISAPPPKPGAEPVIKQPLASGAKRGSVVQPQQQRPRMSLIPSVLRKPQIAPQASHSNGTDTAKPQTNADFRRLLLERK